jgi:ligand-binding sensor domain-containing protein
VTRVAVVARAMTSGVLLAACAPVSGSGGGDEAAPIAVSRAEERVQIGQFRRVQAVAVSRRFVYAASGAGIAVYDRQFEKWLPPLTRANGFDDTQVTVLAGDPVEEALWYGVPGAVVMYRPFTEQWQRTTVVGVPEVIAFERQASAGGALLPGGGDVFVRSGGRWTRISRIGLATAMPSAPTASQLLLSPSLPEIYARYPTLRLPPEQWLRAATRDPLRVVEPMRVVSGAISPDRDSEVWLGTDGDGLLRVDPTMGQGIALPYGLFERGVGALARAADGVWIGGLGDPLVTAGVSRGGVTFTTSDLQRWRWIEGTIGVPLANRRTSSLDARGARLWMGTDRGLVRIRTNSANAAAETSAEVVQWNALAGLPDDRVLALAPRGDGTWVGTMRGLAWVTDSGAPSAALPSRVASGRPITALQWTGDSLWVGTPSGLVLMPAALTVDAGGIVAGNTVVTREETQALATSDSVLLVATARDLWQLVRQPGQTLARLASLDQGALASIAPIVRVAIDAQSIVVAGRGGVLVQSRRTGAVRRVAAVGELLAPPTDVVLTRDWIWIGTARQLVRWHRTSDGLVP